MNTIPKKTNTPKVAKTAKPPKTVKIGNKTVVPGTLEALKLGDDIVRKHNYRYGE